MEYVCENRYIFTHCRWRFAIALLLVSVTRGWAIPAVLWAESAQKEPQRSRAVLKNKRVQFQMFTECRNAAPLRMKMADFPLARGKGRRALGWALVRDNEAHPGAPRHHYQESLSQTESAKPPWPPMLDHRAISREEIHFPRVGDYLVLKGDFHCHSLYSDGLVTPEVRVWEAWRDGLDILNLTDHPEYMDTAFPSDVGRGFGRVKALARELGIVLIRSAELTTMHSASPPFSDFVVSFIQDELKMKGDFFSAIRAARDQGAVIIWAHPRNEWTQEARRLLEQGWLDGIELSNAQTAGAAGTTIKAETSFYPQVMEWCLQNNLGLFASSDAHWPIDHYFNFPKGDLRDMTLVLAATRDNEGIKEAIKQRRTIAYFGEMLWGAERWLKPLVESALAFKDVASIRPKEQVFALSVRNESSFPFKVQFSARNKDVRFRSVVTHLASRSTTLVPFTFKGWDRNASPLTVTLTLTNVYTGVDRPLQIVKSVQ